MKLDDFKLGDIVELNELGISKCKNQTIIDTKKTGINQDCVVVDTLEYSKSLVLRIESTSEQIVVACSHVRPVVKQRCGFRFE